ncbi:stage II sporulation protein D [Paenibacillus curdlanolyticus YK9]|uniref:Stage II sporulation protein D n=1 Tax=Paenibacillus curdlanolyticus YK9 TaxID=717606 RepID=E0IEG9_9BACL|nr:stage II sporulation protein D [Paenibacillus curdlanolyticus]EFM09057.1 stage II sporulation protein D [Paenibacillus curdlanolyticus YK9]
MIGSMNKLGFKGWRRRRAVKGPHRAAHAIGGRLWWVSFAGGIVLGVALLLAGIGHSAGSRSKLDIEADEGAALGLQPAPRTTATSGKAVSELSNKRDKTSKPSSSTGGLNQPSASKSTGPTDKPHTGLEKLRVHVYLTKEGRVETVPLELYVRGVLAGEMPVDFELEALKAQAVAARTYIVRRLAEKDRSGVPGGQADVTDTIDHQVYVPLKELVDRWPAGEEREATLGKLTRAVEETQGLVLTYGGQPIEAAFFSTSNGYTENAEDYWQLSVPYLRSVASPWDSAISPRYKQTVQMGEKELYRKLGVKDDGKAPRVLELTDGRRVKSVVVGGETFTGREVREKLGLASSEFSWTIQDGEVTITTLGMGHGIGMSQWGADGMAKEGASAEQILLHYYTGVKLEQAYKLLAASSDS